MTCLRTWIWNYRWTNWLLFTMAGCSQWLIHRLVMIAWEFRSLVRVMTWPGYADNVLLSNGIQVAIIKHHGAMDAILKLLSWLTGPGSVPSHVGAHPTEMDSACVNFAVWSTYWAPTVRGPWSSPGRSRAPAIQSLQIQLPHVIFRIIKHVENPNE